MKRSTATRRPRFVPEVMSIEQRQLLSLAITCIGQDGQDLVGPDASQGGDGIQDLHLQLAGLTAAVSQIVVTAPGGFEWATQPDPTGAALAEYFPSTTPGDGDLYLNPEIRSDLPAPGATLPLGGSTGSLIELSNGTPLTVTVIYQRTANPVTAGVTVVNLVSATDPMPAITTPANVNSSFQVVSDGQDGTGLSYEQGFVHLVVTAPTGVSFNSTTFSQIAWGLSDQAGLAWDSTPSSLGHNHIYATLRPNANNIADLYFRPARDEAPAAGSTAPTMRLQISLPGVNTAYVTSFAGSAWNLDALTNALNSQSPPTAPTTEAQLRADLMSVSPEYDTIDLPANTTIVITQPLEITHSVKIVGNNATLLFAQGDSAPWPTAASGAIYVDAATYTNIQLELDDFTIRFDPSSPIRWDNPAGTEPALYDPEDNPSGVSHAVIDTRDSNTNLNITILSLTGMTISGPTAFDGSSYLALQTQLAASGDTSNQYVGEQDLDLIRANDQDSGTIDNSSFKGGAITLFGGPWNVTGNTVLGSTADTFSPGAFALHSPHDLILEWNTVSQSDPDGREFRLVSLAVSGFNDIIENNSFGGNAGQVGNELTYNGVTAQYDGINDPEVMLAESSYGVEFVGRPGAISTDGQLLILPDLRSYAFANTTGPGLVVSILAGVNADGSPRMGQAGEWFRVAQQVSLSAGNTLELLMEDPLPAMPAGGYYIVEVTGGFVNNSFVDNTITLRGKSSTGLVLNGEDYGTQIVGNHFVGGSIYNNVYTGTAISLTASIASAPSGNGAFPAPEGWTALPNLGLLVEENTIDDSVGGIVIGVQHEVDYWTSQVVSASETGRVLVTACVVANTFEFDSSFLSSWAASYALDGNNPSQSSVPPTVTIGSGFSAMAPGPYGSPRFPWTVGNAITANGSNQPIFVDPIENIVTVQGNSTELVATSGDITPVSGPTSQVYAAIVNGVVESPLIASQTYNGQPYNPFNLSNLDITAAAPGTSGIQAIMIGQDGSDLVGSGSGPPAPDGYQDLHLVLTGLDPSETIARLEVIGTEPGEEWVDPATASTPQFLVERIAGSSVANLYLWSSNSHLDDTFTINLIYASGETITIPVAGVRFSPSLAVMPGAIAPPSLSSPPIAKPTTPTPTPTPTVPAAPTNLGAALGSLTQIDVAWSPSPGATHYVVERSLDGQNWSALTIDDTAASYLDPNLNYSTTYYYRVMAASGAGVSASSAVVFTQTEPEPDVLSAQSLAIDTTRKTSFFGPVATFTDMNVAAAAGRFVATINWGNGVVTVGTITGQDGIFTVDGKHTYSRVGSFAIHVTVEMPATLVASTSTTSSAIVRLPSKAIVHRAAHPTHRVTKKPPPPKVRRRK